MKKLLITFLLLSCILNLLACGKKQEVEKIYNKNYEKNLIEESKISQQVENVRYMEKLDSPERIDLTDYSSEKEKAYTEDRDKKITLTLDGETLTLTFNDLAQKLNEMLATKQYKNFKINEDLTYNYIHITNKSTTGIYLKDVTEEIRQNLQYYKDIQREVGNNSYNRDILAIKYKNRANDEYYVGKFFTKQKNKVVELEWEESNLDNPETENLSKIKVINISGITDFYYFNSLTDFKAIGKMSLKQWKNEVLSTTNSGIETLKNVEAKPKMETTEKGKTVEKSMSIKPLEFTFDYTITVKDNNIQLEANLTNTLKDYYKLFKNYDIDKCLYKLNIEELFNDGEDINSLFDSVNVEDEELQETDEIATDSEISQEESE